VFVERAAPAVRVLRRNLEALGLEADVVKIVATDVATFAERASPGAVDLVLADPPYAESLDAVVDVLRALRERRVVSADTRIVVERERRADRDLPDWLELERCRTYGDTVLLFLRVARTAERPGVRKP
jgi:16S rRNA (guanine966-N2)-methyltransferase